MHICAKRVQKVEKQRPYEWNEIQRALRVEACTKLMNQHRDQGNLGPMSYCHFYVYDNLL